MKESTTGQTAERYLENWKEQDALAGDAQALAAIAEAERILLLDTA